MSEVYHSILLILNGFDGNFCKEIVMQQMRRQVRLNRKTFVQKLLVKVFASLLAHEYAPTFFVDCGTTCPTHHLKNISNGIINVSMFFALEELDSEYYNHVAGDREAPSSFLQYVSMESFMYRRKRVCTLDATRI